MYRNDRDSQAENAAGDAVSKDEDDAPSETYALTRVPRSRTHSADCSANASVKPWPASSASRPSA